MLGGVYLYVFKPNMEDKDSIESEITTLQAKYDDLYAKSQNKQQYLDDTAKFKADFDKELEKYPATLDQELTVMFVKGLTKDEGDKQFDVSSTGLGRPEQFYALGAGAVAEDGTPAAGTYAAYKGEFPLVYTGSYEGLKDYIDYIMNYKYRMNLSSMNIAYDAENDVYSGNVVMNAYCVVGGERQADTISTDVKNGVENIFHGGDGAAAGKTYAYDADNGASIITKHDIEILLNNANNDTADGIIVSAGGNDTYVTSSENTVETLVFTIAEEEGKIFATYAIGDKSYKKEVTSADLTVYVQSSKRVDSADTNGVKVTVDNKTNVPVFFKVDGDDTTSPRFSVGSKSGTVKVY